MTTELTVREPLVPDFVVTGDNVHRRIKELQEFVGQYMEEGSDYGTIPGTEKPTLYKPGAEKLCDVYGFQRLFEVTQRVEDWDRPLFHYEVRADLVDARSGLTVAQGLGSANSMEGRYRWRNAQRICPACGNEAIIKGKEEYGGGWVCFKKKGGCGAQFKDADPQIVDQQAGRVANDDIFTLVNTLLKMAKKRALVDAVLSATRSSGLFTQDVEDFVPPEPPMNGETGDGGNGGPPKATPRQSREKAAPAKAQSQPTQAEPVDTPWATKLRDLQKEKGLTIPQILDLLQVSGVGDDDPTTAFRRHIAELMMRKDWTAEQAYKDIHDRIITGLKEQTDGQTPDEWEQTVAAGESAIAADIDADGKGDAATVEPAAAAQK